VRYSYPSDCSRTRLLSHKSPRSEAVRWCQPTAAATAAAVAVVVVAAVWKSASPVALTKPSIRAASRVTNCIELGVTIPTTSRLTTPLPPPSNTTGADAQPGSTPELTFIVIVMIGTDAPCRTQPVPGHPALPAFVLPSVTARYEPAASSWFTTGGWKNADCVPLFRVSRAAS